ncbi:hypothetical protein V7O62_02260 [Methanolobus sp. ZRKC2]|uniref:hypothetical protein n=1 Tax=Methanolobus sp. ZRKC2 TaxID=3125783 RepID=UPI003253F1C0
MVDLLNIDFEQFLRELLFALIYPFKVILESIWGIISLLIGSFVGLVGNFFALFNALYTLVVTFFTAWIPSPWLVPIVSMLIIALVLRLYWFLKDVSIHGYKV